jgi:hypothetical protein
MPFGGSKVVILKRSDIDLCRTDDTLQINKILSEQTAVFIARRISAIIYMNRIRAKREPLGDRSAVSDLSPGISLRYFDGQQAGLPRRSATPSSPQKSAKSHGDELIAGWKAQRFSARIRQAARSREQALGRWPIAWRAWLIPQKKFSKDRNSKKCRGANLETATWKFRLLGSAAWA